MLVLIDLAKYFENIRPGVAENTTTGLMPFGLKISFAPFLILIPTVEKKLYNAPLRHVP